MATKPKDRYASCRALADDIERWAADEPVSAWREPVSRRLLRLLTRHRTGVTAAGAAVLVALAGTGAVLAVRTRANADLKLANSALASANQKVTRSNADLQAANERKQARFGLALEAIKTFHTGVSRDILLKEKAFEGLRKRLLASAADFYGKPDAPGSERLDLLRGLLDLGGAHQRIGELEPARAAFEESLKLVDQLPSKIDSKSARVLLGRCHWNLAAVEIEASHPDRAIAAEMKASMIQQQLVDEYPKDLPPMVDLVNTDLSTGYNVLNIVSWGQKGVPKAADARNARPFACLMTSVPP